MGSKEMTLRSWPARLLPSDSLLIETRVPAFSLTVRRPACLPDSERRAGISRGPVWAVVGARGRVCRVTAAQGDKGRVV